MDSFYLATAKMAMQYVNEKIDIGASNKFSDMFDPRTVITVKLCTMELYDQVDAELASYPDAREVNKNNEFEFNKRYLKANADKARQLGCGNCAEQSALAFTYLENHKVFPIDWVCTESFSHAFVIVNRQKASNLNNYLSWGETAVICDPWRGVTDYAKSQPSLLSGLELKWLYGRVA